MLLERGGVFSNESVRRRPMNFVHWRAVDQDGYDLLKRLLGKQGGRSRRMVTGKLGSFAATRQKIMPGVEHRSRKDLNNRAENSQIPARKRGRAMQGFRSWRGLQRFVGVFSTLRNLSFPSRPSRRSAISIHLLSFIFATHRKSDGQTEGQFTKLELVKRQIYDRQSLICSRCGRARPADHDAPDVRQSQSCTPIHSPDHVAGLQQAMRLRLGSEVR